MRGIKEGEEELNEIQKLLEEIANEGFEEGNGKRVKVKVTKVVRLGINNSANVDRPLKVELENEYQAYRVLRGKAGLREKGQRWSKVFLDEDLNWAERRKRVELRKKLKELRKEGIYCFIEGEVIKKKVTKLKIGVLSFIRSSSIKNSRVFRWAMLLQEHRFTIKHIPSRNNVGADFLSRST